jgi:hypothetical protein
MRLSNQFNNTLQGESAVQLPLHCLAAKSWLVSLDHHQADDRKAHH